MEKLVSFKVAKALKEAGYPQDIEHVSYGYSINSFGYYDEPYDYYALYNYHHTHPEEMICFDSMSIFEKGCEYCVAPTYLQVWLWLWREMKIFIETKIHFDSVKGYYVTAFIINDNVTKHIETSDPEEAIEKAIEYLVDNNLIK